MFKSFLIFWLNKDYVQNLRLNLLLLGLQIGLITYFFNQLPPQIPFFLSLPWGEARLSSPVGLFTLPIISFSILAINTFLASLVFGISRFLAKILLHTTTLGNIIFIFIIINLILLFR